eukprot:s1_g1915.t1
MTRPTNSYGRVDKILHWLIAFNIGATLIFSPGMASLTDQEKLIQYGDHATSVTSILVLMVIRLVWRLTHPAPDLPNTMRPWEKLTAKGTHIALYALIFFQIGVGILLASTTNVEFQVAPLNLNYTSWQLVSQDFHGVLLLAHDIGAAIIAGLIGLHIAAALKHHFWDKDDVLKRMLPFARP